MTTHRKSRSGRTAGELAASRAAMFGALISASHACTLEQVPGLVSEQAGRVGLRDVLIYLADLQQEVLSRWSPSPSRPVRASAGSCASTGPWPAGPSSTAGSCRPPSATPSTGGCRWWTTPTGWASCGSPLRARTARRCWTWSGWPGWWPCWWSRSVH
ncbi:hypothetical protein ACFQYP_22350 [Nonomuraea antimicrobica]